jgi:fumarate hydratase class II
VKICTEVFWIMTQYCRRVGGYQLFGDTDSSIMVLKVEPTFSSETLVVTHQTTTRHNTEVRSVITGNLETHVAYRLRVFSTE